MPENIPQTRPFGHTFYGRLLLCLVLVFHYIGVASADLTIQKNAISEQMRSYLAAEPREPQFQLDVSRIQEFYAPRSFIPAWVNLDGPTTLAEQWRRFIDSARDEGLNPENYHASLIEKQWHKKTVIELAVLELLLTDAFFRYSEHVSTGRMTPDEVDFFWEINKQKFDPVAHLRYLLTVEDFQSEVAKLAPQHEGYVRLREALARYRQQADWGGWPSIPDGPILRFGQRHDHVIVLRERLIVEGDLNLGPVRDERLFDQAVKFAVERFQVRHGLKMDGVVGKNTRSVMNIPIRDLIAKIKLNMDRWRWLPRNLGNRYILVNVASFELSVIEDNKPDFTMWVIVGTPDRQTPVIRGRLHSVVFNPYWTIPPTVLLEDIIPKQKVDPSFFARKGIRVLQNGREQDLAKVDWTKIDRDHMPYIFRQDPGPDNPLGQIKFLFSNDFDIYLHDTPKRSKFDNQSRSFSSGCIRVENPLKLASYVLGKDNGWNENKIKQTIRTGETRKIPVSSRIPVYVLYFTGWVGEKDAVHFRQDVYKRDEFYQECDAVDRAFP